MASLHRIGLQVDARWSAEPLARPSSISRRRVADMRFATARAIVIAWLMIPLVVPIAFAVLALFAWRYDARARRAYEATLSEAEKRQFRALRRVHPTKWRAAIALKQAEAAATAAQDAGPRRPKKRGPKPIAQQTEMPAQDAPVTARRPGIDRD
jgi:hypothetical protein